MCRRLKPSPFNGRARGRRAEARLYRISARIPCSAGADFEDQRAHERHAADSYGERDGDVAVGIPHVGLNSGNQAVSDHADDAEEKAEAHASSGEDECGEEHTHR